MRALFSSVVVAFAVLTFAQTTKPPTTTVVGSKRLQDVNVVQGNISVSVPGVDPVLVQTVTGTVAVSSMPPVTVDPVLVQTVTPKPDAIWVTSTVGSGSAVTATQAGTWTVQQGTPPWSVSQSGAWTVQPGNTANSTPWVVRIVDQAGSDLDVFKPNDLYTAANDHGLLILGQDSGTPARYRALLVDSTGAVKTDPTGVTVQPVSGTVGITGSVTVTDGAGALNVIVDSGSVTAAQSVASNLKAEVVGATTPGDTFTNPTTAVNTFSLVGGWDDATSRWVRVTTDRTDGDDVAVHTTASALDTDAHLRMFDGTNWDRVRGTTGFGLYSDLRGINGVAPSVGNGASGTGVLRVTIANDSTGTTIATQGTASNLKVEAVGPVAEAGGASGNPLRMGGVVEVEGATMTSTNQVDQDISSLKTDEEGRLYVRTQHPNPFQCNLSAATGDSAICTDLSSSTTVYVTDILISNGATAGSIIINHGTGTACGTGTTVLVPAIYLAANTGVVWPMQTPYKITWASGLDICADVTSLNPYSVAVRGYYFK